MKEQAILNYLKKKESGTPLDPSEQALEVCFGKIARSHRIRAKFDPQKKEDLWERLLQAYDQQYAKKSFSVFDTLFQHFTLQRTLTFASSAFVFIVLFSITLPWSLKYSSSNIAYYNTPSLQVASSTSKDRALTRDSKEYITAWNVNQLSESMFEKNDSNIDWDSAELMSASASPQEKTLENVPQSSVSDSSHIKWAPADLTINAPSQEKTLSNAPQTSASISPQSTYGAVSSDQYIPKSSEPTSALSKQSPELWGSAWGALQDSEDRSKKNESDFGWATANQQSKKLSVQKTTLSLTTNDSVSNPLSPLSVTNPSSMPLTPLRTTIILCLSIFFATISTWLLWKITKT